MANITILHLSDLHIKSSTDDTLNLFQYIVTAISRRVVDSELILILVSGDIAFSGKKEEYDATTSLFRELASGVNDLFKKPVRWVLVPGNHDGTFKTASLSRTLLIDGVLRGGSSSIDGSVIQTCVQPQEHYFSFETNLCAND